jgi:N-methylhydantoinase A
VPEPDRFTKAYFEESGSLETPVFLGEQLWPGAHLAGPAIIEEPTTTIVVYPGTTADVTSGHNYLLDTHVRNKS